jgi:hypothetical protein
MKPSLARIALAIVALIAVIAGPVWADPLPGEVLKFYQLPLNNTFVPLPPGAVYTNGAPTPFPGHDELSTALFNGTFYQGTYMADDFCDYQSTPIVHVMWWGSYMSNYYNQVQMFLITFESDVAANSPSNTFPFSHPGTNILSQIVTLGPLAPLSGTFTETLLPLGPGFQCDNNLYQYNAELRVPVPEQSNNVMWLKIVALTQDPLLRWGWHNRDYGLQDPLACTAPGVVPGEVNLGGIVQPRWHFQDDAVTGPIFAFPQSITNVQVQQPNYIRTFYAPPCDGNFPSNSFSKDLAFALYTTSIPTNPCPPLTNPPTKFLQPPKVDQPFIDQNGVNVYDITPKVLGDDFLCSLTGPITDIHIWGSWLNDQIGTLQNVFVSFWSDIPATNDVYSRPGVQLWSTNFAASDYTFQFWTNSNEYFFDPNQNAIVGQDSIVLRYNFCIDPARAFIQTNGVTYWLVIQAQSQSGTFGWKSATTKCFDNAVWGDTPGPLWQELRYPPGHGLAGQGFDLAFELTTLVPFSTWQQQYFGCTNCAQAQPGADPDGDGVINTNEFTAGTVPTNSASYFHVTSIVRSGAGSNDVTLTWAAVGGHSYVVQTNRPPVSGDYTNNFSDLSLTIPAPGVGEISLTYTDGGGATNKPTRYYRVRPGPPVCQ